MVSGWVLQIVAISDLINRLDHSDMSQVSYGYFKDPLLYFVSSTYKYCYG